MCHCRINKFDIVRSNVLRRSSEWKQRGMVEKRYTNLRSLLIKTTCWQDHPKFTILLLSIPWLIVVFNALWKHWQTRHLCRNVTSGRRIASLWCKSFKKRWILINKGIFACKFHLGVVRVSEILLPLMKRCLQNPEQFLSDLPERKGYTYMPFLFVYTDELLRMKDEASLRVQVQMKLLGLYKKVWIYNNTKTYLRYIVRTSVIYSWGRD